MVALAQNMDQSPKCIPPHRGYYSAKQKECAREDTALLWLAALWTS